MKKFLSIILAILMVVTMLPMAVLPASAATATGGCDGSHSGYTAISGRTTINKAGNYYLTGDVSANGAYYSLKIYCSGTVTLCLNGYDIYQAGTASVVVDIIATGGDLTVNLCDCKGTGEIYRNNRSYMGIYLEGNSSNGYYATLNMYGGTVRDCSSGVNTKANARFNMYEGTIKDSLYYGVFQDSSDGKVNIYGGTITGNLEGIRVCSADGVTLTGSPVIKDNTNGDLYIRIKNSTVIAENLSVSSPITIAQDSAAAGDYAVLKVDSADMINSFKYINDTKTLVYVDGQICFHGDSHTFKDATCVAPKTCIACGVTEGDIDATAHSWANLDGICANGCGATCAHENQTGLACEICGADIHVCSNYNNGFCTECDAYEPAELKDGYYQIKNGGNLFWYANYINTVDRTANAVLTADIDLENRPWTPIGSTGENSNNFRGIFDGQNYTIRGLYVEGGRAGLGFFGEVRTGTVKNFTIYGEVVVNTEVDYVGGVIGSICGVNGETDLERNGAIIQNIRSFVNLTAKAHGVGMIGGFVGYANHQSLIENCSWYGTFDAGKYRVDSGAGGFIGKIRENTSEVTIRNCGAYGTIKTNYAKNSYNNTPTIYMGGFLSFSNTNAKTTIENCLFAGKFERGANLTDEAFLGAFGTLRSVNAIKNCYYLGDDGLEAVHSDSSLKPGSDNVEIIKVTEEQLKSGEVAYKLQEANEIWGQSIGTDAYPVLGGEDVYCGYTACDDETMVYTNDSTISATKPDHAWDEGSLTRPTKTADGYYTYTCSACGQIKTEPVLRAANYDDYTKALEDLRAYLDSDMLTDENKGYISEWLATYDTDEAYGFIAGEEATVQQYIDATAYYASEIEAAIEDCLAGNHSGNGETCEICGATIKFATVTDGTNTYYAADADTLNKAVTAILETGSRTFTVELPADTEAEMITAIRRAICDTEGVADGSIHLTLKGVTSIPGTTNWDGVAFGPRNAQWDENNVEIVSHEEVTQLASVKLPDATEIGAQAFYVCENLVSVSAPKAQTIGAQAFGYTALTSVEFPELTTIPTDMFGGTWTLSSAKFPKVTTIEQNGLMIGFGFAPENNPTPFPLELTAEGDITFNGSNHFNIADQNYSGKVDLVLNIDKKDQVTFNDDGTAAWQVRDDLSYTFKSITFTCTDGTTNHSYTYTDNGDGTHDKECLFCDYVEVDNEAHTGGTATCTEQAKCEHCGASYGEVDKNNHDETVAYVNGFCPNCDAFEPAKLVNGVYEISNAGNLYWFADKVTNENAAYGSADAILTCDIRVNEGTMTEASTGARVWTPIGKHGYGVNIPYTGTFEGNGKTVSGLYFNDTSANLAVGLFSLVGEGGKVQNVGVADSNLCGGQSIGAVAGGNYGTVTGCYNTGTVIGSGNSVGGVVGSNRGTVTDCSNTGTVSGENSVGGVVGSNRGTVTDCSNTGTVSGENSVGGVVGSNNGTVTGCYNTGTVSGSDEVGGVAGDNSHSTVEGCYNTGTVNGESSVGGVAGSGSTTQGCYNTGTVSGTNNVGGVVGFMVGEAILMGCYNSGSVNGTTDVGGVVGLTNATVTNCYFDSTVYTGDAIGNNYGTATDVEGKSTAQFASGEVAYLLSQGENGSIWGQDLDNGKPVQTTPTFNGAKVYCGYTSCGDTAAKYTNDETISAEKPDHTQKPTYTDNGNGTHSAVYPCCGTTVTEEHSGGTATCSEQAKCEHCGASYGEFDWTNHEGEYVTVWFNDYQHVSEYECCHIESSVVYEDHKYENYTVTTPADCVNNAWETGTCICGDTHTREIAGSATDHNWSNKDGICTNCGEVCPHEKYTDGICDNCDYECPHEWDEGVLTRPVYDAVLGSKNGYYTYTCTVCGEEKTETVKSADYSAYEAVSEEINGLLQSDDLTSEAKQAIYSAANECGLLSNDLTESEQNIVDDLVAELQQIVDTAEEKIASGEYVKADYTKISQAINAIEDKIRFEDVTDEGKAGLEEIKKQLEEMMADETTSAADLAELEKALEEYEAELDKGIEDGTLVKLNGYKIGTELSDNWKEKLEAEGLIDEFEDFVNNQKYTDEAVAALEEMEEFLTSLEGTVAENAENIAKFYEMFNSFTASVENCLRGTHNFKDYEITSPAKCGKNAIETRTCRLCAETDEREVEGTALSHSFTKYEETEAPECEKAGKEVAYCDHGCGATDENEIPALEHIPLAAVKENEVEADCENAGSYDLVVYCDVCDKEISRVTETVDALGHTELPAVKENEVKSDCENAGSYDLVVYCDVCGEEISRVTETVDALGHTELPAVKENEVKPDCENAGSYDLVVYCDVCGEEISRVTETVDALGHAFTLYTVTVAPTCEEAGKQISVCDNGCGATDEQAVSALGHSFTKYVSNNDASCEADGTKTAHCDNGCGKINTVTDKGSKLDHVDANGDDVCDDCHSDLHVSVEDCECTCHRTDFFNRFVYKILQFIRKLFGINSKCDCGTVHTEGLTPFWKIIGA